MNRIILFSPSHLNDEINISHIHREALIQAHQRPGFTVMSIIHEGRLIGIMGVKEIHKGVGEVFAFLSQKPHSFLMSLHKSAKELINYCRDELKMHRIQATCQTNCKEARKWIERLGFGFEGTLKAYDPLTEEDHHIFGRVF